MKRPSAGWMALGVAVVTLARPAGVAAFDRAVELLIPRVIKLYGMGAGLQAGYGSGVLISPDGLVLTVFSLLIDARRIKAVTADGTVYAAEVVCRDPDRQLALLRLKPWEDDAESHATVGPFPYFDLARDVPLAGGEWVLAAGNAFKVAEGAEPVSLAHGIFSIRTRLDARRNVKEFPYHGDVLIIDAVTSNPGAPGSAVVNLDGEFVGMIGRVVTSNRTHTHFNYAMPRDVLADFVREATAAAAPDGEATPPSTTARRDKSDANVAAEIGLRFSAFGYRKVLPFIEQVRAGSPAEQAGLRKDDLILSVNGSTVQDVDGCDNRLRLLGRDEPVDLVVRRGRTILSVQIKREAAP